MLALVAERKIIRVEVSEDANDIIDAVCSEHSMTKTGVASRIFQWFAEQPDLVKRGVLGMLGDAKPDLARIILKRWSDEPRPGRVISRDPPDDAALARPPRAARRD